MITDIKIVYNASQDCFFLCYLLGLTRASCQVDALVVTAPNAILVVLMLSPLLSSSVLVVSAVATIASHEMPPLESVPQLFPIVISTPQPLAHAPIGGSHS
jgi:hypothetical protein